MLLLLLLLLRWMLILVDKHQVVGRDHVLVLNLRQTECGGNGV